MNSTGGATLRIACVLVLNIHSYIQFIRNDVLVLVQVYVSLTMEGTETLEDFNDGTLTQLWANLLFICYFGVTMIVVLNMLIAMMNNSYQR